MFYRFFIFLELFDFDTHCLPLFTFFIIIQFIPTKSSVLLFNLSCNTSRVFDSASIKDKTMLLQYFALPSEY